MHMTDSCPGPVKIGDWIVRADSNSLSSDGVTRTIQPLSMDILLYLAERQGTVVPAQELLDAFWANRVVGDDAVHRRIADLRRNLGDDSKNPAYIETLSKRGYRLVADVKRLAPEPTVRRGKLVWATVAPVAVIVCILALSVVLRGEKKATSDAAITTARSLLLQDRHQDAYDALLAGADLSDPRIQALLQELTVAVSILTDPAGVDVFYHYAGARPEWVALGRTPIENLLLPRGNYKLRLGEDVFMNATNPGVTLNSARQAARVIEMPIDPIPDGMVYVPGGKYRLGAWGFNDEIDLGGFLIDRTEVTNAEYFAFVEAGGYTDPAIWQPIIDASEGGLTWEIIRERFRDSTGHAGPAGWQLGAGLAGQRDWPVVGVSWYEANAYLAYREKSLPSVQHWLRATLGPMEWKYPFASFVVPPSNIGGAALEPVGSRLAAESHGAFDLIGNANEWTTSKDARGTAVIGSSFQDPPWSHNFPQFVDPLYRGNDIGFRGIRRTAQSTPDATPDIDAFEDFTTSVRRVSDEMFEGIRLSYEYHEGTVTAADVEVIAEVPSDHWIRRQISVPTGRDDEGMPVYIYLPRRSAPPYQSVFYLPPADSWSPAFKADSVALDNYQIDFVLLSGRALVWPVYTGSYERYDNIQAAPMPQRAVRSLERNRLIRDEIGRVIDYLESDPEFDGTKIALAALSHGAIVASYVLATERRLKAAILYSVGIAPPNPLFASPQNDPNVFWARVEQPTLIMNGRYDPIRPHHFVLAPLVQLLATPDENKKSVLYDSAHWPLPRFQMMRDSLDWLDLYLGPVDMRPSD